jgi:hypothetical protein
MLDLIGGVSAFVLRAINFVLDIWVSITRAQRFARLVATGRPDPEPEIKVPPDPKVLPLAAERALGEAEQRRNGPPIRGG